MKLLNKSLEKELKEVFHTMKDEVNVVLFTTQEDCETCEQTRSFMEELNKTGDKINFIHYDINEHPKAVDKYDIVRTPAIILESKQDGYKGVKFNGIPAGHEVNSFISSVLEVSGVGEILPQSTLKRVDAIKKPVHIQVFVTLG